MQYIRASPNPKPEQKEPPKCKINISRVADSPQYRNLIICSMILPVIATSFFVAAASITEWKTVFFKFRKLYDSNKDSLSLNRTSKSYISSIDKLIFVNGTVSTKHSNGVSLPSDVVGIVFNTEDNKMGPWCMMNFKAGIWQNCYTPIPDHILANLSCLQVPVELDFEKPTNWNFNRSSSVNKCSSYLVPNPISGNISTIIFFLKMQNNIISCGIVTILCVISAMILGIISIGKMMVPCSMVCSVLYLTASIFVIFINIIFHIKITKLRTSWGYSFPISTLPLTFGPKNYIDFIDIEIGIPVYLSWVSSMLYFASFCSWTSLTRQMNFESSKAYL